MSKVHLWFYIIGAVALAVAANSISAVWASKENKLSGWFFLMLVISPLVFITFGLVTSKLGLAVSSATIDSLLTISSIMVGIFLFGGWNTLSLYQFAGISLAIIGIVLMQFQK